MNCVRIPKELYSFDDIPKQGAGEKMIMKRTNTFKLKPTKEQERKLFELADNCSKLWNEINYKRRQSFFKGKINWNTDEEYNKYK